MFALKWAIKNPRIVVAIACMSVSLAHAQTQSLGDLIDRAKLLKQSQLSTGNVKAAPSKESTEALTQPLLWLLSGVDERFEAVIIYRAKVYTATNTEIDSLRLGPWRIVDINANGVHLIANKTHKHKEIVLEPHRLGTSAHAHYKSLMRQNRSSLSTFDVHDTTQAMTPSQMLATQLPVGSNVQGMEANVQAGNVRESPINVQQLERK